MKSHSTLTWILAAGVVVALFLFFNSRQSNSILSNENERLKFERDSIIGYDMEQSIMKEIKSKEREDSLIGYNSVLIKADSINKITIRNEKAKLRYLTRAGRDRVRDSILRAANIQTGSR